VIIPDLISSDFGCSTHDDDYDDEDDDDDDDDDGSQNDGADESGSSHQSGSSSGSRTRRRRRGKRLFENNISCHTRSLVLLLDALGLGTVDLLGHSFGGFLAQVWIVLELMSPLEDMI
jgi:pimeloyl-ACP methyl ester carboxylesterase